MHSNITVKKARGAEIRNFVQSIARLRVDLYRAPPFNIKTDLTRETKYLEKFTEDPLSIAALIFDGATLVGVSLGIPILSEPGHIHSHFKPLGPSLSIYFYFGKSILLEKYRGLGLAHHFFDIREEHARENGFHYTCFYESDNTQQEANFAALHAFWRRRGYVDLVYDDIIPDRDDCPITGRIRHFWVHDLHAPAPKKEASLSLKN